MKFHKRKWTFQKLQRDSARESRRKIAQRGGTTVEDRKKAGPKTGLSNFFQKQQQSILESTWQIIQVTFYIIPTTFCYLKSNLKCLDKADCLWNLFFLLLKCAILITLSKTLLVF